MARGQSRALLAGIRPRAAEPKRGGDRVSDLRASAGRLRQDAGRAARRNPGGIGARPRVQLPAALAAHRHQSGGSGHERGLADLPDRRAADDRCAGGDLPHRQRAAGNAGRACGPVPGRPDRRDRRARGPGMVRVDVLAAREQRPARIPGDRARRGDALRRGGPRAGRERRSGPARDTAGGPCSDGSRSGFGLASGPGRARDGRSRPLGRRGRNQRSGGSSQRTGANRRNGGTGGRAAHRRRCPDLEIEPARRRYGPQPGCPRPASAGFPSSRGDPCLAPQSERG